MRIAIGADHTGFALKQELGTCLHELGHGVIDLGTMSQVPVDYPAALAHRWRRTSCWAFARLYAAIPIRRGKESNGARVIGEELARELVRSFFISDFYGGRAPCPPSGED